RSLTNTTSGYTGSATATCTQGSWGLSGTSCASTGCTPGATQYCGTCHCGTMHKLCLANGTWSGCSYGDGCQQSGTQCR
ncbi:MAG: hypothetical protein KC635_11880, partial [Myxococcales bacterium]|nr:hypothetical protein [Myxococcales bacterium]